MRTFDFTPYYRSTVGFDRLFQYRITMTIAGFAPDEIELVQHGATLLVTGQKGEQPELLHQGIPLSFKQTFNLADHVKVAGANVEHGLLTIDLVREVPEQLKPRRIEISSRNATKVVKQDNQPTQIDVNAKKVA
jgi:molecular chaperone IbpA